MKLELAPRTSKYISNGFWLTMYCSRQSVQLVAVDLTLTVSSSSNSLSTHGKEYERFCDSSFVSQLKNCTRSSTSKKNHPNTKKDCEAQRGIRSWRVTLLKEEIREKEKGGTE